MIVPGNTIKLTNSGTKSAVVPDSQSHVAKAVSNIKKKHAEAFIRLQPTSSQTDKTNKQKDDDVSGGRGIVYIGHIPDGFFEDEMHQYFSQFGQITRLKLARSRKTGKSKGYAFIEFKFVEVAKVVAETMNNYLLNDRLLKANLVDKKYPSSFWNQPSCRPQNCPLARNRRIDIKHKNSVLTPAKELARQGRRRRQLTKTLLRLKEAGVDYEIEVKDQVKVSPTTENVPKVESKKLEKQETKIEKPEKSNVTYEDSPPVLVVDESDTEIEFNEPSFVIRKSLKRQSYSPSNEQEPKVKKSRVSRSQTQTSKTVSPKQINHSPRKKQNNEPKLGCSQETRSGRVSIIPKHISSGFQITLNSLKQFKTDGLSPPNSPQKLNGSVSKKGESPGKSKGGNMLTGTSDDKSVNTSGTVSPKGQKSKAKKSGVSDDATVDGNQLPQERRNSLNKAANRTPNKRKGVEHKLTETLSTSSFVEGISPKTTVKESPSNKSAKKLHLLATSEKKIKKQKSPPNTPVDKKTQSEKKTTPTKKLSSKNPSNTPKPSPKQISFVKKSGSVDKTVKKEKVTPKTPASRKNLLEKNSISRKSPKVLSAVKKVSSTEKKLKPLKSPKTPISRKSQVKSPGSGSKLTPLFHSTAVKKHK